MKTYNGIELGPLLEEDGKLLQALIQMTNPINLVEFGFLRGASTRIMLEAMSPDAKLTSFDNTITSNVPKDPRFKLEKIGQEDFPTEMKDIDFVFLDASHFFELNKITFERLLGSLTEDALIIVHDTGKWFANVFEFERGYEFEGGWLHCPEEREFVNWIKDKYPEWQQIHLNTQRKISHGITILQKYKRLDF